MPFYFEQLETKDVKKAFNDYIEQSMGPIKMWMSDRQWRTFKQNQWAFFYSRFKAKCSIVERR